MDFDSPEEKEFPGLYASETADNKSKKSKEESDYSEGDHDKLSKKDLLIGRRKDKKDKGKDRGYAALEGESSPEEELDAKSPSKSKKSKTFKFTTSKSKEKREKSRDKEKDALSKEDDKEKDKEKEHKKKDKERKEKDKKEKSKTDKDKKDKKSKHAHSSGGSGTGGTAGGGNDSTTEEVLALGYPVFGVSVGLATERSRCHDGVELPLVVRDCIDYLQENGLKCDHIYKVEPIKTRLVHFKRLYNNRERQPETDELDVPTACSLLKLFLKELPEPVLTTDLVARFEEVASHPEVTKQQEELQQLLEQLPKCNQTLLAWLLLHFDAVIQQERHNKLNAQSLAMLLSPTLQMSHRLMVALLCHCTNLFPDVMLIKYVPPITSTSPKLPDNVEDIQTELRKQESLLTQIHSEMNAGYISKKREEQLWEVQRIITQLKRKLKTFDKKQDKSIDETKPPQPPTAASPQQIATVAAATTTTDDVATQTVVAISMDTTDCSKPKQEILQNGSDDENSVRTITAEVTVLSSTNIDETNTSPQTQDAALNESNASATQTPPIVANSVGGDGYFVDTKTGLLMLPRTHTDWANLLRLQFEFQELTDWKIQLQTRIGSERAELLRLKQTYQQQLARNANNDSSSSVVMDEESIIADEDYEKVIENYVRENNLLEHKKQMLAKELFEEKCECIALQVELSLQQFKKELDAKESIEI